MPIIEAPEGLKFWLEDSNGHVIPSYDMPANDTNDQFPKDFHDINRCVKYVEATHDQHFTIVFKKERGFDSKCDHLAVLVVVDDLFTGLEHEPPKGSRGDLEQDFVWKLESFISTNGDGSYKKHTFKFCDIVRVDDGEAPESDNQNKTKGVIRLYVYRMNHSGCMQRKRNDYGKRLRDSVPQEVPGKDNVMDAVVTTRCAYDTQPCEKPKGASVKREDSYQDDKQRPFFVFELRYLNKAGLVKAKVINPPDPTEDMSLEQLRELAQYALKKKREEATHRVKARRGIKRERSEFHGPARLHKRNKLKENVRKDGLPEVDLLSSSEDELDSKNIKADPDDDILSETGSSIPCA